MGRMVPRAGDLPGIHGRGGHRPAGGRRYPGEVDTAAHRTAAIEAGNRAWELLGKDSRTPDEDAELLTVAFVSRHHWQVAGGAHQWIVGDWMVSRAAAAAGTAHLALVFAERAYAAALDDGTPDWLVASAAEGVARAYGAAGDLDQRDAWCAIAGSMVAAVGNREDRAVVAGQLADTAGFRPPASA